MLGSKKLAAAMLGLALLALPVAAMAGHDHDADDNYYPRPNQPHDNGWHNGWYKHHHDEPAPTGYHRACDGDRDNCHVVANFPPAPVGYHRACDADGDNCRVIRNGPPPVYQPSGEHNYICDADGDDCHWTNNYAPNYWSQYGGYNYGAPYSWYQAQPPAAWSLVQKRNWLISRRRQAMEVMAKMRARGDSSGAQRMLGVYNNLNSRVKAVDRQINRG